MIGNKPYIYRTISLAIKPEGRAYMSEATVQNGKQGKRLSSRIYMLIIGVLIVVVLLVVYGLMSHEKRDYFDKKDQVLKISKSDDLYNVLNNIPDSVPSAQRKQPQPQTVQQGQTVPQSVGGGGVTVINSPDNSNDYMKQLEARLAQAKLQALQEAMGSSLTLQGAQNVIPSSAGAPSGGGSGSIGRSVSQTSNTEYQASNMQSEKEQFLNTAGKNSDDIYLAETTTQQRYKYEVKAGTIIPAVLQTGINSDLPGQIIAKVERNIFDSTTGKDVMIPQGATLIGVYSSQISYGQSRVLMVWNRIIYPDGQNLSLEGMPGADLEGYAGIEDEVNNHYFRVFSNAILMSVFAAAAQVATTGFQNNSNNNSDSNANQAGQIMAGALGMQMGQAGMAMIQKNMNIQPTLEIRPGNEFNVLVTRDVAFKKPYTYKL